MFLTQAKPFSVSWRWKSLEVTPPRLLPFYKYHLASWILIKQPGLVSINSEGFGKLIGRICWRLRG